MLGQRIYEASDALTEVSRSGGTPLVIGDFTAAHPVVPGPPSSAARGPRDSNPRSASRRRTSEWCPSPVRRGHDGAGHSLDEYSSDRSPDELASTPRPMPALRRHVRLGAPYPTLKRKRRHHPAVPRRSTRRARGPARGVGRQRPPGLKILIGMLSGPATSGVPAWGCGTRDSGMRGTDRLGITQRGLVPGSTPAVGPLRDSDNHDWQRSGRCRPISGRLIP